MKQYTNPEIQVLNIITEETTIDMEFTSGNGEDDPP